VGQAVPVIAKAWLDAWKHVTPFLAFPDEVRRVIHTTNAIEAVNRQLRKAIKTKAASRSRTPPASSCTSPSRTPSQWTRTRNWTTALLAFKIRFGDRVPETAT
jgi:putative transposase